MGKAGYNKGVLDPRMISCFKPLVAYDRRDGPQKPRCGSNPSAGKNKTRGDTTMFEDKTLVCKDCGKEFV